MKNIRKNHIGSIARTVSIINVLLCIFLLAASSAFAAFGEDVEKPRPVFAQDGAAITAKLLPRGKSTSVILWFEAIGGDLTDVKALDFTSAKRPEVDQKDFRCDLFAIEIGNVPAGGEITVSARSDFFSSSTKFYLFNANATPAWNDANAQSKIHSNRVRELTFTVKDGGSTDADGAADGKILLNGGPVDSFWGYAIGTLFIRFFGVFLVLGVLMIGMIVCGKFFEAADKRKISLTEASEKPIRVFQIEQAPIAVVAEPEMEPEMIAAIALALHLEMSGPAVESDLTPDGNQSAWNLYGRQKIMGDRLQMFNRHSHSKIF
jgi:hypothetical protein